VAEAPEVLWKRQAPRLVRAAIALGVHPDEAADLVQETLLAAFLARHRFDRERGSFDAWTHAILIRRCANWRRARGRFLRAVTAFAREGRPTPLQPDAVVETRLRLERLVAGLSPARRRVWALLEISGLSVEETAAALRMRESTVRSHLRHARAALQRSAEAEP
jgi:RNA polymerase sigma-70 factor (ECF subfamily)